jgi:transketolase
LEQIRNDVCYHGANVKIVIIGGGLAYGALGVSHHATEDLAVMRAMPNLVVLAPADFAEAEAATKAMMAYEGPVYYRCGYKNEPPVHLNGIQFKIGEAIQIRDGEDLTLIGIGTIMSRVVAAADILQRQGVSVRVVSMHTLKPLDEETVIRAAEETGHIVTVEEHAKYGGLGSAVAEVLAERGAPSKFARASLPDSFVHDVGSHRWLLDRYGLATQCIADKALELLGVRPVADAPATRSRLR